MARSTTHWAKASEAGSILGMEFLLLVYRLFGRWGFRIILIPVMSYFYLVKTEARRASRQYLNRVSSKTSSADLKLSSFKHFLMFGEIILDKFLAWMGRIGKGDVVFEYPEEMAAFEQNQQGGVIVVSHLGNNEVCAALADYLPKIRMTLLVYTQHAERFNSMIEKISGNSRIKTFQVTEMSPTLAMILSDRVQQGEYIIIAGDRTPVSGQQRASRVNFLGGKVNMPQGAFILAGLLKCPVYLLFCLKQQEKYHIYIEKFSERITLARGQREETLHRYVQLYAERLQSYCLKAPLQWFNFFHFWLEDAVPTGSQMTNNE